MLSTHTLVLSVVFRVQSWQAWNCPQTWI
jgi:hypothetical protein